ncbi:hypothetical protein [Sorangium sp. So ce131]|uniref:hypothetical protein n=1 Tax=Sorangium sp. So ce131 TaxID=3133282 RepID=UPI003F61A323
MSSACVTLEEVIEAAHARCASLAPETSGYLALAVSDATSRLPLQIEDRAVLLTTEGTVTVRSRGEPVAPVEAARLLRDLLARLLAASAGSVPNLAATARARPEPDRDPVAVARELEAALIPVNRNAARRALARLARETLRAKDAGRLRRARGGGQPSAAAAATERPARAPAVPARAAEDATCVNAAVAPLAGAAGAPLANVAAAPAVLELTLSPGPVAPAVLELTLNPGPVAGETTAGLTIPASAISSASAEPMPVDAAPPSAHVAESVEQAEVSPEPTPTVVQAAVVEIEAESAPAELPAIPELIEPPRPMAPVAPIATAAPGSATAAAAAPGGERALPGPEAVACDAAACGEAFTSPEGIEAILVELSPDPTGVVPLSQEPTPTVATAVWTDMAESEGGAETSVAGAPACIAEAQANAIETSRAPAVAVLSEREPARFDQEPARFDQEPARLDQEPARLDQEPALLDQEPALPDQEPARLDQEPARLDQEPARLDQEPARLDQEPARLDQEPARLDQEPARLDQEPALQLTPAYGAWPFADRNELAAISAGRRASVAPLDETPAARHTLPWPLPAGRGEVAPSGTAPATPVAESARAEASPISGAEPPATAPPAAAAPAPTPCPPGLAPVDAIVWSASRTARTAPSPDGADAGVSRVDELVARFVARSERSAQRRAARSMKVLAGLDPTLTPPPVAALSADAARSTRALGSPSAEAPRAPRSVPSEGAALAAPLDETSRPPAPLVAPRRRGLSLWLALVALALLCAGLAGTLRPGLFASLAHPLARGALDGAPRADAQPLPAHD